MIINCKECGLPISDKSFFCPHCGYVYSPEKIRKTFKNKRLPNGFGQITYLSKKNLRKPYRVMITVGKTEYGRPIQKLLKPQAYFETYNEAYSALIESHKTQYDVNKDKTLNDIFEEWYKETYPDPQISIATQYMTAWNHVKYLGSRKFNDIHVADIKKCLADNPGISTARMIKFLFNKLYDYAIENEICNENLSRKIKSVDTTLEFKSHHIAFTEEEISILWKHTDNRTVRWILIQCYTGLRPNELCQIKISNINIKEHYMIGGMKTDAGKDRHIPIHPAIEEFVKEQIEFSLKYKSDKFLVNEFGNEVNYSIYRLAFNSAIETLKLNSDHKPHDPRKFFVTVAKKYKLDEYAIKLIVGHSIDDITEKIYTERPIEWLYEQICMINVGM